MKHKNNNKINKQRVNRLNKLHRSNIVEAANNTYKIVTIIVFILVDVYKNKITNIFFHI